MPPKNAPSKKTVEKTKQKVVEDKTFGMKNKKGAKAQKFIQQVQKQVTNIGQTATRRDQLSANEERQKKKEEEERQKEELKMLFKPVLPQQVVAKGVDPKSVLCVFFKQGLCGKGDKCKFSHDMNIERKSEKRSVYDDVRFDSKENDNMSSWDDAKLEDVVNKKHGDENQVKNQTQIVCKFFIEAVENSTYGWFWSCPNEKESNKCMYRHALPPGFSLKRDQKAQEDKEEISLEDLIERERAALGSNVTRITLESFLAWKQRKLKEKKEARSEQDEKKKRDFKLGFFNGLTGRDIFTFNPDMIQNDDENANNDIDYKHRVDDENDGSQQGQDVSKIYDIDLNDLLREAREVDNTGTMASNDRFDHIRSYLNQKQKEKQEQDKLDQACGGADVEDVVDGDGEANDIGDKVQVSNKQLEIDESLFTVEDLDDIQDELEGLDI